MGCINSKDMLEESLCSTPKNAKVPCNVIEEVQGCTSSYGRQYYSPRIYKIMEQAKGNYLSEVESTIEASKDHWTGMEPEYGRNLDSLENSHNMENLAKCALEESTSVSDSKKVGGIVREARNENLELYKENVAFIKSLQMEYPVGDFFSIDGVDDDWMSRSKIIGKGGQATIYASGSRVLKVFNVGYPLVDLRNQWPLALLHKLNPRHPDFMESPACCNSIYNGRLLRDGRFAFEMRREWGDLRKLLDERMKQNGNQRPPFMLPDGNYDESFMSQLMFEIAFGMSDMHKMGTLHRDLKASNVLIGVFHGKKPLKVLMTKRLIRGGDIYCSIADFECSIGILGTGYWRAPEILKMLKNSSSSSMLDICTPKSDVYSYAMICYEIMTGYVPFEDIEDEETSCEEVIEGKRPKLPKHLRPWMRELMDKCWHSDPSQRPTFEKIFHLLKKDFFFSREK